MAPLSYCKGWSRARKQSLASYTTEQARARHESGEIYYALVGRAEDPFAVLEIARGMVGISFLDKDLRENLGYSFQELEPGRLFMARATWREFIGSSDEIASCRTYIFRPMGDVTIHTETFAPSRSMSCLEARADVGANWDAIPLFGQYRDLLRVERVDC